MSDGIYSATSGAISQQRSLEVIANNVANSTAVGFRGDQVAFHEAVAQAQGGAAPAKSLRYVAVAQVKTDTTQGGLRKTGNPLDLALQGDGYFAIQTPQGERYTRSGSFITDPGGVLRTQDGYPVLSEGPTPRQPITIPSGTAMVDIAPDGNVSSDGAAIGQLRIVAFDDPSRLLKEGDVLYSAPQGVTAKSTNETEVVQGFVETANVNPVGSVNELITANRTFDAYQRVIRAFGQLNDRTAREIGSSV
jgi:flagellar basal-body rod protein FlgF